MVMGLRDLPRQFDNDDEPPGELEYSADEAHPSAQDYPTLYYDPIRFPEPADVARLEWEMRSRSPTDYRRDWQIQAVSRDGLKRWSPFSDGKVERRFLARGYVSNCEDLPATTGTPTNTVQQHESLRALQHAVVVAEAVIEAVKERLGPGCPTWLQAEAKDILAPMAGRRTTTIWDRHENRACVRNRGVPLILHDELVFGCTDFRQARTVIPSAYHSAEAAGNEGRRFLHELQREPDDLFQALIARELAWMDQAHLPGIALWACQRVGFCRIALEEARWHNSPPRKQAIARRYTTMPLRHALDQGLRSWTRTMRVQRGRGRRNAMTLRSEPLHASEEFLQRRNQGDPAFADRVDVLAFQVARKEADAKILTEIAMLYDHFGWERPEIVRLPFSLRRCVERAYLGSYVPPLDDDWDEPRGDLQDVAAWLRELRRWGRGIVDATLAATLDRMLRGCPWEEYEMEFESVDGQAAIAYLKSLMPVGFWSDIEAALDAVIAGGPPVPILYDDRTPVGPVWRPTGMNEMAEPIACQGPVLDFPLAEAAWWTAHAARLGPDGLLIRPFREDRAPGAKR